MADEAKPAAPLWRALLSWALFLVAETATQVVFKIAGESLSLDHGFAPMVQTALVNPWVWTGFGLYLADFVLWMSILKEEDLGRAYPLTSLVYVATIAAAVALFHEKVTVLQMVGVGAIMAGVVFLSADENTAERDKREREG